MNLTAPTLMNAAGSGDPGGLPLAANDLAFALLLNLQTVLPEEQTVTASSAAEGPPEQADRGDEDDPEAAWSWLLGVLPAASELTAGFSSQTQGAIAPEFASGRGGRAGDLPGGAWLATETTAGVLPNPLPTESASSDSTIATPLPDGPEPAFVSPRLDLAARTAQNSPRPEPPTADREPTPLPAGQPRRIEAMASLLVPLPMPEQLARSSAERRELAAAAVPKLAAAATHAMPAAELPTAASAEPSAAFELALPPGAEAMIAKAFSEGMAQRLDWMLEQGIARAEIQLHPEELGQIDIQLDIDGSSVRAEFSAQTQEARALLEQGIGRLRDLFEAHGLALAHAGVGGQQGQDRRAPAILRQDAAGTAASTSAESARLARPRSHGGLLSEYA